MIFFEEFAKNLDLGPDAENFREYLLPHAQIIFRSAYRLSGNKQDAEDLTQETFYYGLKYFSQVKDRSKCKYWLFSILRNLFLKELEKNKKHIEIDFERVRSHLPGIDHIENDFLKQEVGQGIRDILQKLDKRLREPIILFYFDKLTYKEIADKLNLPIGTVMSRIARGKVNIKKEMIRVNPP